MWAGSAGQRRIVFEVFLFALSGPPPAPEQREATFEESLALLENTYLLSEQLSPEFVESVGRNALDMGKRFRAAFL